MTSSIVNVISRLLVDLNATMIAAGELLGMNERFGQGVVTFTAAAALVGLSSLATLLTGKKNLKRPRSLSMGSETFVNGTYPARVQAWPCIINSLYLFDPSTPLSEDDTKGMSESLDSKSLPLGLPSMEDLVKTFEGLLKYDRFRCTPVFDKLTGKYKFQEVAVDLMKNHFRSIEADSEAALMAQIEAETHADLKGYGSQPLWEIVRCENTGAGSSAVLLRIHHVIGDGVGLIEVLSHLFKDLSTNQPLSLNIGEKMSGAKVKGNPLILLVRSAISFVYCLSLTLTAFDSNILFTSPQKKNLTMTPKRKVVIFPSIRLDFIKKLKKAADVTVNDVVFTIVSGAILRYCQKKGDPLVCNSNKPRNLRNRALLPLAFPRPSSELQDPSTALRNKWAFISVDMPLNGSTPIDRLRSCNRSTQELKKSPAPLMVYFIQNGILPYLPRFVGHQAAIDLISRHSMVFSNLPGVDQPLALCGSFVRGIQLIFHNLVPQVLLISYKGKVFCNMSLDIDVVKDADELLPALYVEEWKSLAADLGVSSSEEEMFGKGSDRGVFGL